VQKVAPKVVASFTASLGMVCYPPAGVRPDVVVSLMGTMVQNPSYFNGNFFLKKTGPSIDEARNQVVEYFLNTKPASGDYLVFVDSDQVWEAKDMYAYLDRAGKNNLQQVSALIPRYVEPTREMECPFVVRGRPIEGYVETLAMAGGLYALRRDLLEEIWGRWNGVFVSANIGMHEDTSLGQRIKTLGKPLLVDTQFSVGHLKEMTLKFPDDFEV
jgi:hypothetical protein